MTMAEAAPLRSMPRKVWGWEAALMALTAAVKVPSVLFLKAEWHREAAGHLAVGL